MSRIGKHPIAVPAGVEVKVDGSTVTVKGPMSTLTKEFKPSMSIAVDGGFVTVTRPDDEKENRALHGLTRTFFFFLFFFVENEILTWINKNTYPQHDRRRYKRLQEGA